MDLGWAVDGRAVMRQLKLGTAAIPGSTGSSLCAGLPAAGLPSARAALNISCLSNKSLWP